MVEAEPSTEDLHGLVLAQAFQGLLASPSRLQCFTADHRLLSLNRAVLLLFSPFLRSALASVPAPAPATLLLPGVEASTLMRLEDLLATGTAASFREIGQSRLVMEAAALLGLPVQVGRFPETSIQYYFSVPFSTCRPCSLEATRAPRSS